MKVKASAARVASPSGRTLLIIRKNHGGKEIHGIHGGKEIHRGAEIIRGAEISSLGSRPPHLQWPPEYDRLDHVSCNIVFVKQK